VGRSGAGKSSLVQLIFRLRECSAGRILLDGEDVAGLGLQTLRQRLAVIPQEPLLIAGSAQQNLDPFVQMTPEMLQRAVESVGLAGRGSSETCSGSSRAEPFLQQSVATLSAGEQQLLTLARSLLRSVALIAMDEPTSRVDPATDALVQRTVRQQLQHTTVVTIAHRLHTVADYDRILVMRDGCAAECGAPSVLLQNPHGEFRRLVDSLGAAAAAEFCLKVGKGHKIQGPQR